MNVVQYGDGPDPSPSAPGGQGERPISRSDLKLVERALAESWPIPGHIRPVVVRRLLDIVEDPEANDRAVTSASKVLASMSKANLDAIGMAMRAEEFEELKLRLDALEERLKR